MSDESDFGPRNKRKRKIRRLEDVPGSSSSGNTSPIVTTSRRRLTRFIEDDSDSDSGSSIEMPKRRNIPRVASDGDSDSSGSVILKRKRPLRVASDPESDSDSDHGFEGSSSSQWETDLSDNEAPKPTTAKVQDTGVDSDSSDGQSEKCPICLISLTTQEIGTPESCDHVFCSDCIQEWSKNMNTCPVDRQEYRLILVRKNINGGIYKQIPVQPPNPQNDVDIVEDPTFCEVCGLSDREDRMLLCDGCDLGFHLECLNPPLADIPAGSWFCSDCTPEDLVDPEIELYELQLLLDDANDLGRPRGSRRTTSSRLVPRTRQSERVRQRIENNRNQTTNTPEPTQNNSPQEAVSSTTSRSATQPSRRKKKKKKKKPKFRIVYQLDEATGETIAVKKRTRRKKKKPRVLEPPKSVKGRLALQLRMCAPRSVPQNLPDVRVQTHVNTIQMQRYQAGIPTVALFGRDELDYFSESEEEMGGSVVVARRGNRADVAAMRRTRVKNVTLPNSVSSSSDVLGTILESQARFHSKKTKFSLGKDGKFEMEESNGDIGLNNYERFVRRRPTSSYSNSSTRDSVPSSSGQRSDFQSSSSSTGHRNSGLTSTVETSTVGTGSSGGQDQYDTPQDYTQSNLSTIYDVNIDDPKADKKKEELSENNTPRSGTPASESEIDIYSDIETVSTSKVDDIDYKAPSPLPVLTTPNNGTDDDNNDSEPDMVIDTDKINPEPEENAKEETAVTSTVDSNTEVVPNLQPVSSTSEIQSQAVQSSNQLFDDKNIPEKDDDEDSEDGCPNFSIYSKESITMAKNTDITLGTTEDENTQTNQVGEISSSPAVESENNEQRQESLMSPPKKKISMSLGLYSDSEDESVVKKGLGNSFGISDIRNMTEDISEEERSYTPCLDERGPAFKEGIEGLDTEMISDEDRNDFDESHELKTASDGDALEINAKESELDFTRPEDYEEGEIVDKNKNKKTEEPQQNNEEVKKPNKKKDVEKDKDISGNKENESQNTNVKEHSSTFKKLSKNNKERNYREKDRDRSRSREKKGRDSRKDRRREKRKELERYDVRALIAEKPRRLKDKFGRDIRRSDSRSKTRSPSPRRSVSRGRRSMSKSRRSASKSRRSLSRRRTLSRERNKKKRRRSRKRSFSRSKSRSMERKRSRSRLKKRRRSLSRERRRKSRERSKTKSKKQRRSRSRLRSRSLTPKRNQEWIRRPSWTPSLTRSPSPGPRNRSPPINMSPSWTPPRMMDSAMQPHNLTVILTNDANKKKKEKKRKSDKKSKENDRQRKKRRSDRTPPPSKEVFASGDNILVSVSFNKDNETRDVSTKKRRDSEDAAKKNRKDKTRKIKRRRDLTGVKPVAIIDLERSPFKELTPSPKDVIVLSDSDNEETRIMQKDICDLSQLVISPERCMNNYTMGPKTPPEPQVKFTLTTKQTQMRAISNPLHEPDDIEPEGDTQEVVDSLHIGPNTPPEPPNSPPSSPDAYDPFEPTKSRSPTPEPMQTTQSNITLDLDDNREDSMSEARTGIMEVEKSNNSITPTPEVMKSHTPPLADVQPADSQSSIQATPESSLGKSPERSVNPTAQTPSITVSKPVAQTIPFSSVPTSIITSTPASSNLAPPRINILNSTIITPPHVVSSIPQRIVLPNTVKSSPVKISPTKPAIKSTPIKPMPSKPTSRKVPGRNQNGSDNAEASLGLDSPYSPGSSDYEDLFEPPAEVVKPAPKPKTVTTKSPNKIQNAFDALFGSSPFNKIKPKADTKTNNKYSKKTLPVSGKGSKQVGVKLDEDNLKILDELPNSAVEMQVKDKFLKKLNRQERVVEEVKLVLKPHYNKKHINKEEYKDILRRAVPKICHNKSGEINPTKIKNLIEAYVKKVRHSKKVTSSSSVPQKA